MFTPVLFLVWRDAAPTNLPPLGATTALAHRPTPLDPNQPFAKDGPGPALTLELAFADEAAFRHTVPALTLPGRFEAQAMRRRAFATPAPAALPVPCTLLVEYLGRCEDPQAWLDHYDAHHPPIMVRFPAVREVATYRPAADLPLPPGAIAASALQRNKVVFDTAAALAHALASPILREMRADRDAFPPFDGHATHFPTLTHDALAPLTPLAAPP